MNQYQVTISVPITGTVKLKSFIVTGADAAEAETKAETMAMAGEAEESNVDYEYAPSPEWNYTIVKIFPITLAFDTGNRGTMIVETDCITITVDNDYEDFIRKQPTTVAVVEALTSGEPISIEQLLSLGFRSASFNEL